jgi:AAA15 family ATPase/GTPase
MKIKEIQIQNFRSIENILVDFKENPRVLVGINESGKTNIIEALRLINPEFPILDTDVRLTEKGPAEKSEILFISKLENKELEEVYQKVCRKILVEDIDKPILKVNKKPINLKEFLWNNFSEGLYKIDIREKSRRSTYWKFDREIEFIFNFKKPKVGVNFSFQNKKGETINVSNFELIDQTSYPDIPTEQLEEASPEILNNIIGNAITEIVDKNLPRVICWKYEDEYLLPPLINTSSFAQNPKNCIPLMNMFILAGIPEDKIGEKINETIKSFPISLRSFFRKIASESTKYFKNAWPEYRNIKISLEPSGENIECGVYGGKTIQHFPLKSDGFKRFISILLMLSIPSEKKLLNNALILIDEADQSLHPSGCRYLMEQLIKIAESNYVVYSTHSIFMIDRENIKRHYIVEKKNEITTTKEADEQSYRDEEVIYKALGASVYEILNEKNILFEGWRDKKLFETAIKRNKDIQNFFKKNGISHAEGVKDQGIQEISSILEFAKRKLLIISDADGVARERQEKFIQDKRWGVWKRYDELLDMRKIKTGEDFIKKDILKKNLFDVLKKLNINFRENEIEFPDCGRLRYIKGLLSSQSTDKKLQEEIIKELKDATFKNLKISDIEEDYFKFVEKLREEIIKL